MPSVKCHHCYALVASGAYCSECGKLLESAVPEAEDSIQTAEFKNADASMWKQAGACHPVDTSAATASNLKIRLEYQHKFCIANQHGSIPLRLTNRGHGTITEIEVVATSSAFSAYKAPSPRKVNLPANAHTRFLPLDFDLAGRSGPYGVELKGYYCDEKGNPHAFCGLLTLIVRDPSHRNTRVVVDDAWGVDLSNLLDTEAIGELLIRNSGGIDASRSVQTAPDGNGGIKPSDDWLPVALEEDFERTRSLNAWLKKKKGPGRLPTGASSSPVRRGTRPFRVGLLTLADGGEERLVHLWTRSSCHLGRSKPPADLVCVRLPADQHNTLISRRHCALEVKDGVVYLSDGPSRNGTFLDQQRIAAQTPLRSGQVISLARQMELAFRAFRQVDHAQHVGRIFDACSSLSDCNRTLSQYDLKNASATAPLECFQLRRRDGFRRKLSYLFIQSAALIGASASAAIQLDSDAASPLHARLLHENQSLFIEDLDTPAGTWVDGVRLMPHEPCRLGETASIRMGDEQLCFRQLEP